MPCSGNYEDAIRIVSYNARYERHEAMVEPYFGKFANISVGEEIITAFLAAAYIKCR